MKKLSDFMADLKSAIMFITILPAGKGVKFSPVGMTRCFPVVGTILGFILICFDAAASRLWSTPVVSFLDVLLLVVLTGAFHLDGLGDAADGLFSHRSKEMALEIMKDSRTGMMGLVAVFCSLALKTAGIYSVKSVNSEFCIALIFLIVPSFARAGMIFAVRHFRYGREKGTGHALFEKKLPLSYLAFISVPAVLSIFLGTRGAIIDFAFIATLLLIFRFYEKTMGCITGDMLGAMTEVTESILFLVAGATLI